MCVEHLKKNQEDMQFRFMDLLEMNISVRLSLYADHNRQCWSQILKSYHQRNSHKVHIKINEHIF